MRISFRHQVRRQSQPSEFVVHPFDFVRKTCLSTCLNTCEHDRFLLRSASRAYWENMTKCMKMVFKAPVADEDIPSIVDYPVKTYGNEQPK
jgi:hypothetical protein